MKSFRLSLLLLIPLTLLACSEKEGEASQSMPNPDPTPMDQLIGGEENIFIGQNYEYAFTYPLDWVYGDKELQIYQNSTSVGFYPLPHPEEIPLIMEDSLPPISSVGDFTSSESQEEYIAAFMEAGAKDLKTAGGFKEVSFEVMVSSETHDGFPITYLSVNADGSPMLVTLIFTPTKAYVFDTYNSEPSSPKSALFKEWAAFFQSFTIIEPPTGFNKHNSEDFVMLYPEGWNFGEEEEAFMEENQTHLFPHPHESDILMADPYPYDSETTSAEEAIQGFADASLEFDQSQEGFVNISPLTAEKLGSGFTFYTQVSSIGDRVSLEAYLPTEESIYIFQYYTDIASWEADFQAVKEMLGTLRFTYYFR